MGDDNIVNGAFDDEFHIDGSPCQPHNETSDDGDHNVDSQEEDRDDSDIAGYISVANDEYYNDDYDNSSVKQEEKDDFATIGFPDETDDENSEYHDDYATAQNTDEDDSDLMSICGKDEDYEYDDDYASVENEYEDDSGLIGFIDEDEYCDYDSYYANVENEDEDDSNLAGDSDEYVEDSKMGDFDKDASDWFYKGKKNEYTGDGPSNGQKQMKAPSAKRILQDLVKKKKPRVARIDLENDAENSLKCPISELEHENSADCPRWFPLIQPLIQHVYECVQDSPTKCCPHCNLLCRDRSNFKKHLGRHYSLVYKCPIPGCNKECPGPSDLTWHMLHEHNKYTGSENAKWSCCVCQRILNSKGGVMKHFTSHHLMNTVVCQGGISIPEFCLSQHRDCDCADQDMANTFRCGIAGCGQIFKNQTELVGHFKDCECHGLIQRVQTQDWVGGRQTEDRRPPHHIVMSNDLVVERSGHKGPMTLYEHVLIIRLLEFPYPEQPYQLNWVTIQRRHFNTEPNVRSVKEISQYYGRHLRLKPQTGNDH